MWLTPPDPISLTELRAAIRGRDKRSSASSPHRPAPTASQREAARRRAINADAKTRITDASRALDEP